MPENKANTQVKEKKETEKVLKKVFNSPKENRLNLRCQRERYFVRPTGSSRMKVT